jgi:hypothetical protein
MRSPKQHHSWKLDDERRKRPAVSSGYAAARTRNNNSPANYTHEKKYTGTYY